MIISKFNYRALSRQSNNGKRYYTLEDSPDTSPMASVTTILDSTKPPEDKAALDNWRNAVGHQRAHAITSEAANRGTRMHKYLEDYVTTGALAVPGSNPYAIQANKMAQQIVNNGLCNVTEFWGVEVPLCYPNVYAGTTDLVCEWKGKAAIGDFKQTNKPKTEERVQDYRLQLVAYGLAHNEMYGTNIQTGVILMCSKDFEYQEFVVDGADWKKTEQLWWRRLESYYVSIG